MSKVSKIAIDLIEAIQSRLTRVQQQTHENTTSIFMTGVEVRATKRALSELTDRHVTFTTTVGAVNNDVRAHTDKIVKLESRDETLLARIKEVAFENDKREEQQVLRDQSNVKSLKDLRDSTQKGFDHVAEDVRRLMESTQRLNERVGKIESLVNVGNAAFQQMVGVEHRVGEIETRLNSAAPAAQMPSDHAWVNKKLSGVFSVAEELESRIQKLEQDAQPKPRFEKRYVRAIVKDGDTLAVFATVPPSASDPAGERPVVARVYRVVADAAGPSLSLVALTEEPIQISAGTADEQKVRA